MSRLDRVLAAGVRQRQLEEARTGTKPPDWNKFFNGEPSMEDMDIDELAAYKAMAIRAADVLNWYEQKSSDHYDEELEFLDKASRFDAQPMLHYNVETSHAVATAVRDWIPYIRKLQQNGTPRYPFYYLHRDIPHFYSQGGEAYHDALVRLKLYFEGKVREQAEAQLFGRMHI